MLWIIKWIIIVVLIIQFITNVGFRYCVLHPRLIFVNASKDLILWVKYKRWNELTRFGCMDIYIADERQPFGSGKTLNMVANAWEIYNKYNDVEVFNFDKMEWVKQYVHIYSNVALRGLPYVPLVNTYQLVNIATGESSFKDDNVHIYLFLFDELGRLFNNRDWKSNLNSDLLGALLQQRKNHLIIKGTVQDFSLFDATMRKICTNVYSCTKKWRVLSLRSYYAKDLERANFNTSMVATRAQFCRFATDALYYSYDTNEIVGQLQKEIEAGVHLSNEEILKNADNSGSDVRTLTRVGRRFRKHTRG